MASHCAAKHATYHGSEQRARESERKRGGVCVCVCGGWAMMSFLIRGKRVNKKSVMEAAGAIRAVK